LGNNPKVPRPHRVAVNLTPEELTELRALAARDRITTSAALRRAVRDAAGLPALIRPRGTSFDEGYDHALQQELVLLNLIATEQAIKLLEAIAPYGARGDEVVVQAAQAAQSRIARGIPDGLGDRPDGGS
jgi:hypothetical protein